LFYELLGFIFNGQDEMEKSEIMSEFQ